MKACTVRLPYLIETHSRWRGDLSSLSLAHGVASIWMCIACGLGAAAAAGCWACNLLVLPATSPTAQIETKTAETRRLPEKIFIGDFQLHSKYWECMQRRRLSI